MKLAYSLGTAGVAVASKTEKVNKANKVSCRKQTLKLAKAGYNFSCCQNEY